MPTEASHALLCDDDADPDAAQARDGVAAPPRDDAESALLANVATEPAKGRAAGLVSAVSFSFGFFVVFLAFSATQNLQSSLNDDLGYWSVASIYGALMAASIVAPAGVARLGLRSSLFVGAVSYVGFMAANIHPAWETLIPTAVANGAGGALLWTAQGVYITRCAEMHAAERREDRASAMGFYQGIFFSIFQLNQVVGNVLASALLSSDTTSETELFLVFVAVASVGALIMLVVRIPAGATPQLPPTETLRILGRREMQLLLPIFVAHGMSMGFAAGDFTKDFVTESIGENFIGYNMALYGGLNVAGSLVLGRLSDSVGRAPLLISGLAIHVTTLVALYLWTVQEDAYAVLLGAGAALGLADSIWNTQMCAMVGSVFSGNTEAAFANFKMWQSLGVAAALFYGPHLGVRTKIVLLIAALAMGVGASLVVLRRRTTSQRSI